MKEHSARLPSGVFVLWAIISAVVLVCTSVSVYRLVQVWPKENFEQKILGSAKRQGEWFTKNQQPQGDFVYERYAYSGDATTDNHIVRQAGALYGLAQLYRETRDPKIQSSVEKNIAYFQNISATMSASSVAITHNKDTPTNATALVVLGLVEYLESDESLRTTENLEYLVRLSNYLMSTQASHSAYFNHLVPKPDESDYNNGETMYALIRSFRLTGKGEYLASVRRAAAYFMEHYGTTDYNAAFFSWGMAGFANLYKEDPKDEYWVFLRNYADKYLSARGNGYEEYLDGKSETEIAPGVAVYIEGVTHIAWIAKEKDPEAYRKLSLHSRQVLEYLLKYEINGPYGKFHIDKDAVRGAVCAQVQCTTTRIDFMQHNMSAILLYARFLM